MEPWVEKMRARLEREEAIRKEPSPMVTAQGEAYFPKGMTVIKACAFRGEQLLRTAVLPGSIRRIGERAFENCRNLSTLVLNDGLEEIDSQAFDGCASLQTLVVPDSVKKVNWYTFSGLPIRQAVRSASGEVLYRCPNIPGMGQYTVPDTVRRIQSGAFPEQKDLKKVILPEGLEHIHLRAFHKTSISAVTLPASLTCVERESFSYSDSLEKIVVLCPSEALKSGYFTRCPRVRIEVPGQQLPFEEGWRIRGRGTLTRNWRLKPPDRDFWADTAFAALARRCAQGQTDAMLELADYYDALSGEEFYTAAANFWRCRAIVYGSERARRWKDNRFREKPETPIPVAMSPHLESADGQMLRSLGFEHFTPGRWYSISYKDQNGVVEVSAHSSTDGPDSDGFGMEENYDTWYLDEFLNPIPGAKMIGDHSGSSCRNMPEKFEYYREQAALALKNARELL